MECRRDTCATDGDVRHREIGIVLLTAPGDVIVERLATRTNNTFGKLPEKVARTLALRQEIEPLLQRGASAVIDTSVPLSDVVAQVLRIVCDSD